MKVTSKRIQLAILGALVAVSAACSGTAEKGAIPPSGPPQKKVTDSDQIASFNPMVDILFVVDDSGSMASHQRNLSRNIKLFTAEIQKTKFLHYHIGVITTSFDNVAPYDPTAPSDPWGRSTCDDPNGSRACGDGRLVRWKTNVPYIDNNTPNGLSILETNLLVGTNGSGEEHILDPIGSALSSPLENTVNAGFLRKDASLAIVILTDTEDQSVKYADPKNLFDFLVNLKGGRADKVLAYGALIPSSIANPTCPRDDGPPFRIEQFIALAKGLEYNVCDPDYGTKLAVVAADVAQKVGRVMYLSRPPVVNTIQVTYGTQVIPNDADKGWVYDPVRNALIFSPNIVLTQQPAGAQLSVTFTAGTY